RVAADPGRSSLPAEQRSSDRQIDEASEKEGRPPPYRLVNHGGDALAGRAGAVDLRVGLQQRMGASRHFRRPEHARGGEPATGRRDRRYGNDHRARAAHERYSARSSSANDLAATSKVPPAGTSARGCRRSRRRGGSLVSTTSSHDLPNRSSGAVNVIGSWWALKRM